MAINLRNKKVLITGSTDGVGKLLAIELSKLGAKVIVHGRTQSKIDETLEELGGSGHDSLLINFSNISEQPKAFENIKELDIWSIVLGCGMKGLRRGWQPNSLSRW